ncbi:hypothetical protein B0J11DRAFT_521638 [Dendryphion nanum]|uniref:RING-type domain-containing protein n=1 Tax=Dendryphion nanum TaxID=256645 RepID=A0A9P9IVL4_9PLEO|nr:hypothetical protein B0J11DRAFT_521638 [Dendryphion nanum]
MSAFNDPGFMATGHLIDTTQHTIAAPNPPENEKCGICLEGKEGGLLRKPHTCNHLFHAGCLDEWANSTNDNAHKCPVCRIEFTPEHRPFVARPLTGGQDDSENYGNNDDWLGGHNHQNRRPSSEYNR